jgi:hypothetical protein
MDWTPQELHLLEQLLETRREQRLYVAVEHLRREFDQKGWTVTDLSAAIANLKSHGMVEVRIGRGPSPGLVSPRSSRCRRTSRAAHHHRAGAPDRPAFDPESRRQD